MPSGGRRPGAGRKSKAEKYERPINRAEKLIVDKLPHLVGKMLELADGVMVSETDEKTGEERIYMRPPDRQAISDLLNRIMGKPTERHELSGPDGGPIAFDDLSDDERAARAAALLERARARRAGQTPPGSEPG